MAVATLSQSHKLLHHQEGDDSTQHPQPNHHVGHVVVGGSMMVVMVMVIMVMIIMVMVMIVMVMNVISHVMFMIVM